MRRQIDPTIIGVALWVIGSSFVSAGLEVGSLRCEYLEDPIGIEEREPRLSWVVRSEERGQRQTAYQVLVASGEALLEADRGDLWDSGKVESDQTLHLAYAGQPLRSRRVCVWKVRVWDRDGVVSAWSETAMWSMGLLEPWDWKAQWISYRDNEPLHASRENLYLPPPRHYRKEFPSDKEVKRAVVYVSALGLVDVHLNGRRVGDAWFLPGWSDYRRRVYYRTFDVTSQVRQGGNALGAIVADGWYSGYLGYGLLVGYGPHKTGRNIYGKRPALLVQLEIEYQDGSRHTVVTDPSWRVTDRGPFLEADMLMGETYDARRELPGWSTAGFNGAGWEPAIPAEANGSLRALFHDNRGEREVELGFIEPERLQAYSGVPIRVTEEIVAQSQTEPQPSVYVYDLGQNFAGVIRLNVHGEAGTQVRIRYGEMLHPDGRLMTENLRRARAIDTYILKGEPAGETWVPRFTYHGFQYVELTGLNEAPALAAVVGLVLHSDTPSVGSFECSDEVINRLYRNITWTQRANFFEVPTDCPQRDERFGWMGDAQVYVGAASCNADVGAFFTKWMDDVEEAQLPFGAYPDYAPYPMSHGQRYKSFGTAWMDAGIICPWTIYQVYGDTRIIERHYDSMQRFMDFRTAVSPGRRGVSIGNPWGDWLSLAEETPVEYIDACYFAYTARLMAEMSAAIGREVEARHYQGLFDEIQRVFVQDYVNDDGTLKVPTQTAYALALYVDLIPELLEVRAATQLADMIRRNDHRMATGFLGTRVLLPVLSSEGQHDLAVRLLQSRRFPSWGYEVINGATTIWERWDSYTKEEAFGRHNAAMNSFSHYAFGAVGEWMFRALAGIRSQGPGFKHLILRPGPPTPESNPEHPPIDWVRATYDSIRGRVVSDWRMTEDGFDYHVSIPANTAARVELPRVGDGGVSEGGRPVGELAEVKPLGESKDRIVLYVESGDYRFEVR